MDEKLRELADRLGIATAYTDCGLKAACHEVSDETVRFFAADFFNRHDRRLVQHNPLPFDIYQRIGGSQVNRHVRRE